MSAFHHYHRLLIRLLIITYCLFGLSACPRLIPDQVENITDEDMLAVDMQVVDMQVDIICMPNAERCNGTRRQICNQNGTKWDELDCPNGETCRRKDEQEGCYAPIRCGDLEVEGTEECDEVAIDCEYGIDDCQVCNNQCEWESQDAPHCGDGVVNGPEDCDGDWFCGTDCRFSAPCASSEVGCPNIEWILIEGGELEGETLSSYDLLKTEVTVGQYLTCVDAGMCSLPYTHGEFDPSGADWRRVDIQNQPIRNITFRQMLGFSRWIGATIPTELEWEWAARSRNNNWSTPWGGEITTCDLAVIGFRGDQHNCDFDSPLPVCSMTASNTIDGLCDMIGNVDEVVIKKGSNCSTLECMLANGFTKGMHWRPYHLEPSRLSGIHWHYVLQDVPRSFVERYSISGSPLLTFVDYTGFRPRRLRQGESPLGALCADGTLSPSETCEDRNIITETCSSGDDCTEYICNAQCQLVRPLIGRCGDGYINRPEEECDGQQVCQADCKLPPCYELETHRNLCPPIETVHLEEGLLQAGTSVSLPNVYTEMMLPNGTHQIKAFDMAKYEVTVAQYRACVHAGVCTPPHCDANTVNSITICDNPEDDFPCERSLVHVPICNYALNREDHPVNFVTPEQAQVFASWVGFRLPKTMEWEYAAKSTMDYLYPWTRDLSLASCDEANYRYYISSTEGDFNCSRLGTTPVEDQHLGASLQGIYNLLGNVSEYTIDHDLFHARGGHFENGRNFIYSVIKDVIFDYSGIYFYGGGIRLVKGALCGDGLIQAGEECDDGNTATESCESDEPNCTVCNSKCELVIGEQGVCGDDYLNEGEECDGDDHCMSTCTWAPCVSTQQGCPDLDFRTIEGGSFLMGSNRYAEDFLINSMLSTTPVHTVNVETFKMMRKEVTVGMYRACVNAGVCTEPNIPADDQDQCTWTNEIGSNENYPMNCISWHHSIILADWLGVRLPTEAEWEFAARSRGLDLDYPWGDEEPSCAFDVVSQCMLREVCNTEYGNTAQGLCNMAGSLAEWLQDDRHIDYTNAPFDGSAWCINECATSVLDSHYDPLDQRKKVIRGTHRSSHTNLRGLTFGRYTHFANDTHPSLGVRFAKDK